MTTTQLAFAGESPKSFCGICHRPLSNPVSVRVGIGPVCRARTHSAEEQTMKNGKEPDWALWGKRFDYHGYYGGEAHCLILRNGHTVICTQPWDNQGLSITNGAEDIATAVCKAHDIPLDQLVWIEHYIHLEKGNLEHSFDRVIFQSITHEPHLPLFDLQDRGMHLRHPAWKYMEPKDAETLFGIKFQEDVG